MPNAWKLAASAVCLVSASTTAWGVACSPGTLTDYISLGGAGCTIGSTTFSDFTLLGPLSPGDTPISPSLVQVTPFSGPSDADFLFSVSDSALAGEVLRLLFGFNASTAPGDGFIHAESELGGSAVTPDGSVTLVDDLCLGGLLDPGTFSCGGTPATMIPFDIGSDSELLTMTDFAAVDFISRAVDIALDGGFNGAAALQNARISFTTQTPIPVPEPAPLALAAIGLASFGWARARPVRA